MTRFATQRHPARAIAVVAAALAAAHLTGCIGLAPQELKATDRGAPVYSARAVVPLGSEVSRIEIDYASVRGSAPQSLPAFTQATLDGRSINGPVDLRNDVRVQQAHVAYQRVHFASRPVELEWFAGLGGVRVDWTAQPLGGVQAGLSKRNEWFGVAAGVGSRWKIAPWIALEGRVSTSYALTSLTSDKIAGKTTAELGFALRPVPSLALRAGYARSVTEIDEKLTESPLTFRARGGYLGLGWTF